MIARAKRVSGDAGERAMTDVSITITVNFPMSEQNTRLARDMLEAATQLDPNAADAAAWLAELTVSDYLNYWNNTGRTALQNANNLTARLTAAANPPPRAYYAQGFVHRARGKHPDARDAFFEARTRNPNFIRAYAHEGAQQINLGNWNAGQQLVDQAIAMSPTHPSIGVFQCIKGRGYFFEAVAANAARFADAIHWLELSRADRDNLWYNRAYLMAAYQLVGRTTDAQNELAAFKLNYTQIVVPDDIHTKFEVRNPNGNAAQAVKNGRKAMLDAIKTI